jgi:hypothetical protein
MPDIGKTGKSLPKEMQSVDPSLVDLGGLGTESITQTDVETPRLKILEPGSPQIVKGPYRLDDAEAGDFCNTATGDVWRDEITVIPCNFDTHYFEWPKVRGKGAPIKDHGEDPSILRRCVTNEKNQHTLPNGNRVEETARWHLLIQNGVQWDRVLFQLTSTRLKASRKWLTAIRAETCMIDGNPWKPPLFWRAWTLRSSGAKNDMGNWSTFVPERGVRLLDLDQALIPLARAFSLDARAENLRFKPESYDGPTIEGAAVRSPVHGRQTIESGVTGEQMIGEPLPH